MNTTDFLEKINDIDEDLIDGAAKAGKSKKIPAAKYIAAAACLIVVAASVFAAGSYMKNRPVQTEEIKNSAAQSVTEKITAGGSGPVSETAASDGTESENSTEKSRDGETEMYADTVYGGMKSGDGGNSTASQYGGVFIPAVPKNNVKATGDKLTDAEAKAYFEEHREHIVSALSASGVSADNIRIADKGYSHLCYDGTTVDYIELRQSFRDYPVYNGDKLVAIITLYKLDGQIYDSPAFGAPWFDEYNNFLKNHKGQKLVYIYAGQYAEIIIAPDNTCCNPLGYDVSGYFEGIDDPYGYFFNEGAVYTP